MTHVNVPATRTWLLAVIIGAPSGIASMAFAQDAAPDAAASTPSTSPPPEAAAAKAPEGILPLADYSGSITDRKFLTGDWNGSRSDLARRGLSFSLDWTQVGQTVVSGGRRIDWDYGGSLDLVGTADLQRMGVMPGGILKLRVESRYGETVNDDSGAILPVNTDGFFPLTDRVNQGIPATITELNYTQYLSETFGVFLGKLQTLDGDPNEFASGRGRSQFMNANFVFNGAGALVIPYSVLGGGVVWLPAPEVMFSSTMLNTHDSSTTTGFDHVEDGWTWSTEVDFQYRLGSLPGGQNVGFAYAFAGDFTQLGGRLQIVPGEGVQLPEEDDSWFAYWSAWQYLYTPDAAPEKIKPGDGRPDLAGIGLFARLGFADTDTNPVEWSGSLGLGGRGLIPGRDEDTYGAAYVYTELQQTRGFEVLGLEGSTQGAEIFYNAEITPAVHLTVDGQWINNAFPSVDDAIVLGLRMNISF